VGITHDASFVRRVDKHRFRCPRGQLNPHRPAPTCNPRFPVPRRMPRCRTSLSANCFATALGRECPPKESARARLRENSAFSAKTLTTDQSLIHLDQLQTVIAVPHRVGQRPPHRRSAKIRTRSGSRHRGIAIRVVDAARGQAVDADLCRLLADSKAALESAGETYECAADDRGLPKGTAVPLASPERNAIRLPVGTPAGCGDSTTTSLSSRREGVAESLSTHRRCRLGEPSRPRIEKA
jgi:hypothetical protein